MKFLVALACLLTIAFAKPGHLGLGLGHLAAPGFGYSSVTAHAAPVAVAHHAPLVAHSAVAHHAALPAVAHAALPAVAHAALPAVAHAALPAAAPVAAYAAPAVAAYAAPAAVAHHATVTHHAVAAPAIAHHAAVAAPLAVARHAAVAAPVAVAHHAAIAAPAAVAHHAAYAAPAAVAHHAAFAAPAAVAYSAPVAAAVAAPVAIEKTQYHAQDVLGQASYGHSEAFQAHHAVQDAAGNKLGSYSWVAPDGQVVHGKYVADALGYRVHSNAVPIGPAPVGETPEVIAARSAHFAAHVAAKSHLRYRRGIALAAPAVAYTAAVATPLHYTAHYAPAVVSPIVHTKALHYGFF